MGALHFNLELKTHEWKFISAWLNTSMCYGCRSNAVLAHVLQIKDTPCMRIYQHDHLSSSFYVLQTIVFTVRYRF